MLSPFTASQFLQAYLHSTEKCVKLMPAHVWQGILCLTYDIGFIKKMRINAELKTATDDTGYPRKN